MISEQELLADLWRHSGREIELWMMRIYLDQECVKRGVWYEEIDGVRYYPITLPTTPILD